MISQRGMLRKLIERYGSNEQRLIQEYAAAERRGTVKWLSNDHDIAPEEYACRLIVDGKKKRWAKGI